MTHTRGMYGNMKYFKYGNFIFNFYIMNLIYKILKIHIIIARP